MVPSNVMEVFPDSIANHLFYSFFVLSGDVNNMYIQYVIYNNVDATSDTFFVSVRDAGKTMRQREGEE